MIESNIDDYLADDRFGTLTYLLGQRKAGRIRHLSFSCHGTLPVLEGFLEKYGKDMEFTGLRHRRGHFRPYAFAAARCWVRPISSIMSMRTWWRLPSYSAPSHASTMSLAVSMPTTRAPKATMLVLLCWRLSRAE